MQLWTKSTVDAQKLLVHDGCKGKRTERVHARFVDRLGILVLAFELEREIVRQVSTLMVSPEEPQGVWVPYLEGPKIQHALQSQSVASQAANRVRDLPLY